MLSRCRVFAQIRRRQRELPLVQKPTVDDFSTEDEFHDAIEIATLRKSKPELYHFEQVVPYNSRVYPNDKFKFLENPEKWKGYDHYYKAALKEREIQVEKFHPSDWDLDHDHRMTWWGMTSLAHKNSADLQKWEILQKPKDEKINIGFLLPLFNPLKKIKFTKEEKIERKKLILNGDLPIDQGYVHQDFMSHKHRKMLTGVIGAIDTAQDHYNIMRDQFGMGHFYSVVPFEVSWGEISSFWGNEILPKETQDAPSFKIESKPENKWTITITSLDSSLNSDAEVLHYAVSNLTTETSGDIWSSYLPPIPVKGTGYHRFVVTLYHQKEALEKSVLGDSLADREFSSKSFLKENEENLTPAALRFSQVHWDESVTQTFHKRLEMPQPSFEYDFVDEYPLERPEGIPSGVEHVVVKSWYPQEKKYPRRMGYKSIKPKLKQTNYLSDMNDHFGALSNK